jgi:hypothetical protein
MTSGTLRLEQYPGDCVEFACTKCDRRGRYRKAALIAIHGAHIGLRDLLARMAADCPKVRNPIGNGLCGAHYPELAHD